MTGDHPALTASCRPAYPVRHADILSALPSFLLYSQFIREGVDLWKVVTGGGMGLNISGDTTDTSFYHTAEKQFVFAVPDPRMRYYGRFKDDIFIMFRGSSDAVHEWFSRSKPLRQFL